MRSLASDKIAQIEPKELNLRERGINSSQCVCVCALCIQNACSRTRENEIDRGTQSSNKPFPFSWSFDGNDGDRGGCFRCNLDPTRHDTHTHKIGEISNVSMPFGLPIKIKLSLPIFPVADVATRWRIPIGIHSMWKTMRLSEVAPNVVMPRWHRQ